MRHHVSTISLLVLAGCGGLGGLGAVGDAVVMVRVVDDGTPRAGLSVLALSDTSERLGQAVTDAEGVARLEVAEAGSMWLAANAGEGRGFVTRVTAQEVGETDVGERAVALLESQPTAFLLKGLGYEERVSALSDQLVDFAVGQGVVVAIETYLNAEGWVAGSRVVEVTTETGVETTIAELEELDPARGLRVARIGDGRYVELLVKQEPSSLRLYDAVLHRFVHQVPTGGPRTPLPAGTGPLSALVDGVLTTPAWRFDDAGHASLWVSRFDPVTLRESEQFLWSPQAQMQPARPLAVEFRGGRLFAVAVVDDPDSAQAQVAVFDAATLVELGGFWTSQTHLTRPTDDGSTFFGTRRDGSRVDILQLRALGGDEQLLASYEEPCDATWLTAPPPGPLLLVAKTQATCGAWDELRLSALFGRAETVGLAPLPTAGLPTDASFRQVEPLAAIELDGGQTAVLGTVSAELGGQRLRFWGLAADRWSLLWETAPGPEAWLLGSASGTPTLGLAALPGGRGLQLFPLEAMLTSGGASSCHTWARLKRGLHARASGPWVYYDMLDPLTGRFQVFRAASCLEVTP